MAHFGRNLTLCLRFSVIFCVLLAFLSRFALAELVFGTYGEACLVAILTLFVEQLGQRILQRLVVVLAVTEHVDSRVDSLTQRILVSLAFSCNVVGSTMIGRSTHDG